MTQSIDQVRLRAAAEHLEQVLEYYAEYPEVRGLCESLASLIAAAKAGRILAPLDLRDIPGGWHLAEGTFRDLRDPNLERAYGDFATELQGGWSDREKAILEGMARSSFLPPHGTRA